MTFFRLRGRESTVDRLGRSEWSFSICMCAVVPKKPHVTSSITGNAVDQQSFTLSCDSDSDSQLSSGAVYKWRKSDSDMTSETSKTVVTETANINDPATYDCQVSDDGGTDYSEVSDLFTYTGW